MPLDASESLVSPQMLLWLAASAVAVMLLLGSINRRRSRLTESLRDYVDRNLPNQGTSDPNPNAASEPERDTESNSSQTEEGTESRP